MFARAKGGPFGAARHSSARRQDLGAVTRPDSGGSANQRALNGGVDRRHPGHLLDRAD
jgi:hypothetical protein